MSGPNCQRCGIAAADTEEGILALNGSRLVCGDCDSDLNREHCADTGDIHPLDALNPAAALAAHFEWRRG